MRKKQFFMVCLKELQYIFSSLEEAEHSKEIVLVTLEEIDE